MTTTQILTALELRPGDEFTHHGREWVVVDVFRGWHGTAHIATEGDGLVYVSGGCEFTVRRPAGEGA
ncbi:hypothetical protein OG436_29650 [Streptomyces caniferus]|uniref:hypothetical protein n=1 Tax=Streptomyces caniferus TaxID=285557 RepID=UPI002E2BF196|nr:hypothetical protein [Streptomyces caniferus]